MSCGSVNHSYRGSDFFAAMELRCRSSTLTITICFVVLFSLAGNLVLAESRRPKNVQVELRAKWSGTPILLEAGELLSKEWKDLYWEFTKAWLHSENDSVSWTAKGCLQKILEHGSSLLSQPLAAIFEATLTLRSASPRLVVYQQLAEDSLSSFLSDTGGGNSHANISQSNAVANKLGSSVLTTLYQRRGKCCWVDTGSTLIFDVSELKSWLDSQLGAGNLQPELFDFDHVYPCSDVGSQVVILYGALGTNCFKEFHLVLTEASERGRVKHVVRPVLPEGCESETSNCGKVGAQDTLNFGGYGVELAIKNMEYKAMDDSTVKEGVILEDPRTEYLTEEVRGFIFSKILERKPDLTPEVLAFRDYLLSSSVSDTLDVWDLKDLGYQTAQKILYASNPLQSMEEISQNFPNLVSSLSRMKLNASIREEIVTNQRMVPSGKSLMALNGVLINIEDIDLFMLMDMVHKDLSLADQFFRLKIPQKSIRKLLATPPRPEVNTYRIDFRSNYVHYLNNLEEDDLYRRWRSNLNELLMPVFPGHVHYLRKNLFHAVYVIDPATACGLESIDTIMSMYENNFPMRFGVILYSSNIIKQIEQNGSDLSSLDGFSSEDKASTLVICLFYYIGENYGMKLAFQFLSNVNRQWSQSEDLTDELLEVHHVEAAFVETLVSKATSPPQDILMKVQEEPIYKEKTLESSYFAFKLGLSKMACSFLMNGLIYEPSEEAPMKAMNEELPKIQEHVYYGHITDETDVLDKFLSENGYRRYNPLVIGEGKDQRKFISLSASVLGDHAALKDISYLHSPGTVDELKPVTHILVVDAKTSKGIKLLREAIRYLIQGSKRARIGVLFNVGSDAFSPSLVLAKVFEVAASTLNHKVKVLDFLDQACLVYENGYMPSSSLDAESGKSFLQKVDELAKLNGLPSKELNDALTGISGDYVKNMSKVLLLVHSQLRLELGVHAVVTNGRVVHLNDADMIISEDLGLLEHIEFDHRIKHVMEVVEEVEWKDIHPDVLTSKYISDAIMLISSSMSARERGTDRAHFEILNAKHSAVVLNEDNSFMHIDAVIDPLSPTGQKLAPLLHVLWKCIQPSMRLVLNPVSSLVDLPLKNYYRYVVPTADDYSVVDFSVRGPRAFFSNMPLSKTLTMNLDVPEPWLIEPIVAIHDIDNILLEKLGDTRTLHAVFQLETLVLTGHCSERDHDPPRGLQLILGSKSKPHLVDTIVMANLGYWQMKVLPGVWYLQLAPGRSSDLYTLKETEYGSQSSSLSKRIVIDDLRGSLVHLEVVKKEGMEQEQLLGTVNDDIEEEETDNSWNSNLLKWASGLIGSNEQPKKINEVSLDNSKSGRHGKQINIFSVASGHLYERFLKIMILSVLKNTHRPAKFWFIKNYLSPQFKNVIPHMAIEYGFDYELITYKWPTWLQKQKEKQRIIWAYKILFLDVIFPLSLEKVIFVDADQIVRTDMGELYDMDIKGRALAYTPFCDNNKEMDGYRFWRQGFWKDHLRGRPYHISALYVVDLVRFRQSAAGDQFRVIYETLSKDPNSLSNLDQDLPNYAQHAVPIFSLPQEWLWCESWCGNSTKSKAKTIDLCNNPMTKEPKLQGAKRIVPEWVKLDAEARHFTAKILGGDERDAQETQETLSPPPPSVPSYEISVLEDEAEL